MEAKLKYRFPGTTSFTQDDSDIFFGRNNQIKTIQTSIIVNPTTVIFGKSGTGKSSLIQAGLKPSFLLNKSGNSEFEFIDIAIKEYKKGKDLLQEIRNKITNPDSLNSALSFLDDLKNFWMWSMLKKRQFDHTHYQLNKTIVLVFDQAEDLFSYPEIQIKNLINEIQPVIRQYIPQEIYKIIETKVASDELTIGDKRIAEQAIPIKFLFAIRSDKLHLITRLKEASPDILINSIELLPLNKDEVFAVIENPSQADGQFISPKFIISNEAKEHIFKQLNDRPVNASIYDPDGLIEPFTLQILCSHIERKLVGGNENKTIEKSDILDIEGIIIDFYNDALLQLQLNETDLGVTIKYIEENMLYEPDNRRISIDEIVLKKNIRADSIEKLVELRIFKRDISASGGILYELSHDCLITPILKAKEKRQVITINKNSNDTIEALLQQIAELSSGANSVINQGANNEFQKPVQGQAKQADSKLSIVYNDPSKLISLYVELGHAYKTIKNYEAALDAFYRIINFNECEKLVKNNIYFIIADIHFEISDFAKLHKTYNKLYSTNPRDYKIVSEIARNYASYSSKINDPVFKEKADKFGTLAIELNPEQAVTNTDTGNFYFGLGEYDKAIGYYKKALELDATADYACFNIGLCEERRGNTKDAIRIYKKVLKINPEFIKAYYELGRCYYKMDNLSESLFYYNKTIELNPETADAYHGMAMVYEAKQNLTEAKINYNKTINLNPLASYAYYNLGRLAYQENNFEEALFNFQKSISANPNDYEVYNEIGRCYYGLGKWEEAKENYLKCVQFIANADYTYYNLGIVEEKLGDNEAAKIYLNKAIEINPINTDAYYNLGNILLSESKPADALEMYNKVVFILPEYGSAYNEIGRCYFQLNDFDNALIYYNKCLVLEPNASYAHTNIAWIEEDRGNIELAKAHLYKALEISENDEEAYFALAHCFSMEKNYPESIRFYNKVLEINPKHADAYNNIADCYLSSGNTTLALISIQKALEINNDNETYLKTLSEIKSAEEKNHLTS